MGAFEGPRTEEPVDRAQEAADLALDALKVAMERHGFEVRSAVLVVRLTGPNPATGFDAVLAGATAEDEDVNEALTDLLERGVRVIQHT